MKIETQPQDNCTVTLIVEVEDERVQPALRAAARKLAKNYRIPGFRPGKAPYETVVRYLGEDAIYSEALEALTQDVYRAALEESKIDPYAPGALEDAKLKPMVLTYNVPLKPEVDLGDYRSVRVDYTAPKITDEAVTESMEQWRETRAVTEPVERPAELGDVLVLDVNAFINTGENPSDFLLADKDVALKLEAEADWPMPGFAPQVVGMKAGESKKFDLAFPEGYANESLRGQLAHLEVACKEVKSRTLPEWSDELAKEFGDYESLEDMRAKVREGLVRQATREQDRDYSTLAMDKLLEQTTIKYPPAILEQELESMMHDLDHRLKEQRLTLDDYLKIEGKTRDELRAEYEPLADKRLKRSLALGRLIEQERLTVNDADVEQEIERFTAIFGGSADATAIRKSLDTPESRSSMAMEILSNRAVERLVALAKGEDIPLPAPEAETAGAEIAPEPVATPVPEIEAVTEPAAP